MAMDKELQGIILPPVQKEFLNALVKAFPKRRYTLMATIEEIQRDQGQQDVVEWILLKSNRQI